VQSSSNAVPRPLRNDYRTVTISVLQMTARDLGWETDALMGHWSGPGEPSNGDVVRIPFWVSHVLHLSWCRSPSCQSVSAPEENDYCRESNMGTRCNAGCVDLPHPCVLEQTVRSTVLNLNFSSLSHFNQPLALALATANVNFSTTLTWLNPFYTINTLLPTTTVPARPRSQLRAI
jgi:hypothetical protein